MEMPAASPKGPLTLFLNDCCVVEEGRWALASAIYKAYATWTRLNGLGMPMGREEFHRVMYSKFSYNRSRREVGRQVRTWEGVGLKSDGRTTAPLLIERLEQKVAARLEEVAEMNRHIQLLRDTNAQEIVRAAELACFGF